MRIFLTSVSLLLASSAGLTATPAPPLSPALVAAPSASPSERLDLARRFVALDNPGDSFIDVARQGYSYAVSSQLAAIDDNDQRAAAQRKADGLFAKFEPSIRKRMPELLEAYAQVYADKFSADELRDLVAFASTATGKHYLSTVDALDIHPDVVEVQARLADDLQPLILEFQKQACAERAQQRIAMGDKKAVCPLSRDQQIRSL